MTAVSAAFVLGAVVSVVFAQSPSNPESSSQVTSIPPDGTVEITKPDGTVEITKPDGTVETISPDGTVETITLDGLVTVKAPDGAITTTTPEGITTTSPPSSSPSPSTPTPTQLPSPSATPTPSRNLTLTPTPTITGTASVGSTLIANAGTWDSGVTLIHQWLRNGSAIPTATSSTYPLVTADGGTSITVQVTGSKSGFNSATRTSSAVNVPVSNTPTPTPSPLPSFAGAGSVVLYQYSALWIDYLRVRTGIVSPDTGVSVTARIWCETPGGREIVQYSTIELYRISSRGTVPGAFAADFVDIRDFGPRRVTVHGAHYRIRGEVTASNSSGSTTASLEGFSVESCSR